MMTAAATVPATVAEVLAHDLPEAAPYCSCRAGVYAYTGHESDCAHSQDVQAVTGSHDNEHATPRHAV